MVGNLTPYVNNPTHADGPRSRHSWANHLDQSRSSTAVAGRPVTRATTEA
jgi:hypothetical protein